MKNSLLVISTTMVFSCLLLIPAKDLKAQAAIGATTPDPSAQLDVVSSNKGMLVPRVTTTQRLAISSPADGLLVYDLEKKAFWFYKGDLGWQSISSNALELPYEGSINSSSTLLRLVNEGSGAAISATSNKNMGIWGITNSLTGAGILGDNSAGGEAVVGRTNSDFAAAVTGRNDGSAFGVRGFVNGDNSGKAIAVLGQIGIAGSTGRAGRFENTNSSNKSNTLEVWSNGPGDLSSETDNGNAVNVVVDNSQSIAAGVKSQINTIFGNFGAAAIYGESKGTGGAAGLFYQSNPAGNGNTILARTVGNGRVIYGYTTGLGNAAHFESTNSTNTKAVLEVSAISTAGDLAVFQSGASHTNKARIDGSGRGYFNNGTQNSGADLAEAFSTTDPVDRYEPGDVLSIDPAKDRTVGKSAGAYSTLVLGVYATKPGVLLTEDEIDCKGLDKIPMGVVGVLPTKVCREGGAIRRGDLLVSSSIPGVAMKADTDQLKPGQVLGKALQNFDQPGVGKIQVFVNIK